MTLLFYILDISVVSKNKNYFWRKDKHQLQKQQPTTIFNFWSLQISVFDIECSHLHLIDFSFKFNPPSTNGTLITKPLLSVL